MDEKMLHLDLTRWFYNLEVLQRKNKEKYDSYLFGDLKCRFLN